MVRLQRPQPGDPENRPSAEGIYASEEAAEPYKTKAHGSRRGGMEFPKSTVPSTRGKHGDGVVFLHPCQDSESNPRRGNNDDMIDS